MSRQQGQKGGTEAHSCTDCEHPFCGLPDVPSRIPEPLGVRLGPCPRETRVHGNLAGPETRTGPHRLLILHPSPSLPSALTPSPLNAPAATLNHLPASSQGALLEPRARPSGVRPDPGHSGGGVGVHSEKGSRGSPINRCCALTLRPADAGWCRPVGQYRDVPGRPR